MLSATKQQIKELYEEGQKLQALEQDDACPVEIC